MTLISELVSETLDEHELQLAHRLACLLDDDRWDAASLIESITPVYWERVDDWDRTLDPDNIFRPLYHIHGKATHNCEIFREDTRAYMTFVSGHIEDCLQQLMPISRDNRRMSRTFGPLVKRLKDDGVLPAELARHLWKFNDSINVASKHFDAYMPTRRLRERTFSVMEAAWALVLMRKLSMQLFDLLEIRGRPLPRPWPAFKDEWLTWDREVQDNSETR